MLGMFGVNVGPRQVRFGHVQGRTEKYFPGNLALPLSCYDKPLQGRRHHNFQNKALNDCVYDVGVGYDVSLGRPASQD